MCSIFITIGLSKDLKDIRIVKILDSNLFLSEEGLLIKLAYIQSPSVFSEDSLIAKKIIKYANNQFVKKPDVFRVRLDARLGVF